jgi:hypothetical protein
MNETGVFGISSIASNLVNSKLWSGNAPNILLSENNNKNPENNKNNPKHSKNSG